MIYRWEIDVLEYNTYGTKVVRRIPMSILAVTKTEVTEKVRVAFDAEYDDFRKFWSHRWLLKSIYEEPLPSVADDADRSEKAPIGILSND